MLDQKTADSLVRRILGEYITQLTGKSKAGPETREIISGLMTKLFSPEALDRIHKAAAQIAKGKK